MLAARPTHLKRPDFITRIIFNEKYKLVAPYYVVLFRIMLLPLRPKYTRQHSILENLQFMYFR
jgi:hypothetical protein